MNLKSVLALVIPALFLFTGAVAAEEQMYDLRKNSDTSPGARILQVAVSDDKTVIHLEYTNRDSRWGVAGVNPPGTESAFFIQDAESIRKFELISFSGIGVWPNPTQMEPLTTISFKLIFEPIPKDLKSFHLVEGRVPDEDDLYELTDWHFMNVQLK